MRLVHISDLHFGLHNEVLANNLRDRLAALSPSPDLIVCTGDLANDTNQSLFEQALTYIESVQNACVDNDPTASPEAVIVLGNHDVRRLGFLDRRRFRRPLKVLTQSEPEHYSERDNVWVFGFDSATEGDVGGSGVINDADVERFDARYEELAQKHGSRFTRGARKIVAVHHHPVPVKPYHDRRSQWLTMANAGRFLSAVLSREVDLVLHGHEHIQAQARLWSSLGSGDREVCIVSLGATLRRLERDEQNWFGVVDTSPSEVYVNFYRSRRDRFEEKPHGESFHIQTRSQSAKRAFEEEADSQGYSYHALASICVLDEDGDATRTVECERLSVTDTSCERASCHPVTLPHTSGYVAALRETPLSGRPVSLKKLIPPGRGRHSFKTSIKFDGSLRKEEEMSYRYEWQAVNSFAMDEREFAFMHRRGETSAPNIEFTHYIVADPVRTLTVIVQFPMGFVTTPGLRVMVPDAGKGAGRWRREPEIERTLEESYALRYFETIRTAALRVPCPRKGLSYGIHWTVPPTPVEAEHDQASAVGDRLRRKMSRGPAKDGESEALRELLAGSLTAARNSIMRTEGGGPWGGPLEATFMGFDSRQHLVALAAVVDANDRPRSVEWKLRLKFGEGIAGRAFKANELRIYDAQDEHRHKPDYYTRSDDSIKHEVLAAFPIYPPSPAAKRFAPYGVLSIGSEDANCPLRLAPADAERRMSVSRFHTILNRLLFERLTTVFLGADGQSGAMGDVRVDATPVPRDWFAIDKGYYGVAPYEVSATERASVIVDEAFVSAFGLSRNEARALFGGPRTRRRGLSG